MSIAEHPPYSVTIDPVECWIGERRVFLYYSIETMKKIKRSLGAAALGLTGGILSLDIDALPKALIAGACDENGNPLDPPVTEADITKLPAAAFPYLAQQFTDAFTNTLAEKKRKSALESAETATRQ